MYKKNAFGNPDGSRTDIDDMMAQFVAFDERYFSSGVASPDDMKTRVIVGAKGSGKTVYLRRMRANLKLNKSVYICEMEQELPSTDLIIKFGQNFPENQVTEKWMYLWKVAIMRALVSHILCNDEWNEGVPDELKEQIKNYEKKLFPKYTVAMGIYAEARHILTEFNTNNLFNKYIEKPEWDELDILLNKALKDLSPIYFFVDSVDEEYAHAPMYWLRCQKGLFYRVMRLFRNDTYGNKLHVVISIRDNVLASIYRSEHQTRYINEEHIKLLDWNYSTIKYFFEAKISVLKKCYFLNNDGQKNIESWLGISNITNIQRGIEEPIEQYILRHTRLLPRDIIIIGNSLSEIRNIKETSSSDFDVEKTIRKKVSTAAKGFGNELLQICANQIINNEMPKGAAQKGFSEVYTSIKEYNTTIVEKMKELLLKLQNDKFSFQELQQLEKESDALLGRDNKMFDIMWQNGGLGYIEDGANGQEEIFFADSEYLEFLLPKNKYQYVLRSCIIDALGMAGRMWDKKPVIGGVK